MIDKKKIIALLKEKAREQILQTHEAYQNTHDYQTSDDLKSEGKYDTRGTEAAYLSGALKAREEELRQEEELLDHIPLDHNPDQKEIALGSLIQLKHANQSRWYFLSSAQGGKFLEVDKITIMVVSAFSPLGQELIGRKRHETFELETKTGPREYEILDFF